MTNELLIMLICLLLFLLLLVEFKGYWRTRNRDIQHAMRDIQLYLDESVRHPYIKAVGIIPFDIEREQLRPSFLACLRALNRTFPGADSIRIEFTIDKELFDLLDLPFYKAGSVDYTYKKREVDVKYGIPNIEQINKWNAIADDPIIPELHTFRIWRPDKITFERGLKIIVMYWQVDKELRAQKGGIISNDDIYPIVSSRLGLSEKDVETLSELMITYYQIWDSEVLTLN